jgi:hypothetical protein
MMMATAVSTTAFAQNKVKNIYASSPKLDVEMLQSSEQNVQLNRYLFAGYNTLCLPVSLTAEQLGDITVERLAAIQQEGNVLNLYFVDCTSEGVQAGMPYLIYSPKAQYLRVKNNETMGFDSNLKTIRMSDDKGNTVSFGSGWESIEKEGRYGIPAQQNVTPLESVLIRTEGDKKFLPTRCGFNWDVQASSATELQIKHAALSEVTAIKTVNNENIMNSAAYDLQGRKVNGNTKGLRIQDGRKTMVK